MSLMTFLVIIVLIIFSHHISRNRLRLAPFVFFKEAHTTFSINMITLIVSVGGGCWCVVTAQPRTDI